MGNACSDGLSWSWKVLFLGAYCPGFQDEDRELGVSSVEVCAPGFGVLVFAVPVTARLAVKGGEGGRRRRSGSYTPV